MHNFLFSGFFDLYFFSNYTYNIYFSKIFTYCHKLVGKSHRMITISKERCENSCGFLKYQTTMRLIDWIQQETKKEQRNKKLLQRKL